MMDEQKTTRADIDYEQGLRRFSNKKELYHKYLKGFPDDPNYNGGIKAVKDHDYGMAFQYFHGLKGVAGTLGMQKLYKIVSLAVEALRGEQPEKVLEYLPELETAYMETCEAVKTLEG